MGKGIYNKIKTNILYVAFAETALFWIGGMIGSFLAAIVIAYAGEFTTSLIGPEFSTEFNQWFWLIIITALTIVFMLITMRDSIYVFTSGTMLKKLGALGVGLLIGAAFNGFFCCLAGLTGTVVYSFNMLDARIILLFIAMFCTCSAEEVLLRGFVPAALEKDHSWDTIAFVSGTLFIFHHIPNIIAFGFNAFFCLNVFLLGVFMVLLVRKTGNFWVCCGFHTAWNCTQHYIMGLSTSGASFSGAIFKGECVEGGFFFDKVYGFEGCLCLTVVLVVAIAVTLFVSKDVKKNYLRY